MKISQEGDVFIAEGSDEEFICCSCSDLIQKKEAGFKCLNRVFCEKCQKNWNEENLYDHKFCLIDSLENDGAHSHTKFTRTK